MESRVGERRMGGFMGVLGQVGEIHGARYICMILCTFYFPSHVMQLIFLTCT